MWSRIGRESYDNAAGGNSHRPRVVLRVSRNCWQAAKRSKADYCAEGALRPALKSTESNVRSSKLEANYLKWYAGILSPAYSDRHQSLDVRLRHEAALMDEAMV